MKTSEIFDKIKNSISYQSAKENEDRLSLSLDRYRRHDHGGGEDGDDWLEGYEIDKDFEKGRQAYQYKLDKVNQVLKESGFEPNAKFDLSEKGHFRIEVQLRLK